MNLIGFPNQITLDGITSRGSIVKSPTYHCKHFNILSYTF